MPSRATRAAGTRRETCASCTGGVIIGIISRSDTKRQRLEPCAGQLARTVLRGGGRSNAISLPDYVYGRRRPDPLRRRAGGNGGGAHSATTKVAVGAWEICLPAVYPGYISWEEFMANQRRLADNVNRYAAGH